MVSTSTPELSCLLLTVLYAARDVAGSQVPRPRGVSLSRAPLYAPDGDFACLDGSRSIPFVHVNDDYCDCPDASDEPGTAACPNGLFHCTNAGHRPTNVPSNRVNDGVCDCCDGTDEYGPGATTCPNTCAELGRSAREQAQRKAELLKAGKQQRQELIQRGIQLKQEKEVKLKELQKNREEAERLKQEKEVLKKDAEGLESVALDYYRKLDEEAKKKRLEEETAKNRAEAIETFVKFDSNQDGVVDISELQSRQTFDKDRNGEVSEEEAKYFLGDQESVDQDTFVENCWTNIKPFLMMDAQIFKPPPETGASEAADMQEEEEEEEEDDQVVDEEGEEEEEEQPIEKVESPSMKVEYDEETEKVIERANTARQEYHDADNQVKNIDSEIKNIQEYLEKDFGPEEEYATLQGHCFEYEDNEYIYRLCPFDKTSQQPRSGSSETRLGSWGKWSGPETDRYSRMSYDRGQSCWNGPQRSTTVDVSCGGESRIVSVTEPSRCEYRFEFVTPAACREVPAEAHEEWHDEL